MMRYGLIVWLLTAGAVTMADEVIDSASAIRNTVLRAAPGSDAAAVTQVTLGQVLDVYERRGLWVDVGFGGDAGTTRGWLRLTELRFGAGAATTASSPAQGGGFAGFSRSVSGFLGSFRSRGSNPQVSTATIGIRGLTVAELQTAQPNPAALGAIQAFATSAADAEQFAGAGGLRARDVAAPGASR